MATLEQFKIMLAEVEADIAKSEQGLLELRSVAKYLRKRLNGHADNNPNLPGLGPDKRISKRFANMKLPDAMKKLLKERAAPMHMKEIAKALVQEGFRDRPTLAVSVSTTATRRDDWFKKVGPATFAFKNGEH